LLLSDKGKDAKYKQVYSGDASEITLKDLKPATEYHLKVCACINAYKGEYTNPVSFVTESCEPDRPLPPKLLGGRSKSALNLKWSAAIDNGSKILNYILEYDEGKGREYTEIYRGVKKQFKITKLIPATIYSFRLAAENSIGRSEFSDVAQFSTIGTIPPEPDPPMLGGKGIEFLTLTWIKRQMDEAFTLQMNDESNYFSNKYMGSNLSYTVTDLYRNTEYKFRLAANNEEGQSNYSRTVAFRTLPDRPLPPSKPRTKGQIQPTYCRITWDPPRDNGGSDIQRYHLELEEAKADDGFHMIYNGLETEHCLEQLIPGHTYLLRVFCTSVGGQSDLSDITKIQTPAVAPASCHPPRVFGKPKANSLHLRWAYPDYDGGATVIDFEVQITNPDNSSRLVYRGKDLECTVTALLPGRPYLFQVRAFNKAGAGPWSEYLDVLSGPGVPDAPRNFLVQCRAVNSAIITWEEGVNNGAAITEYRLEWSRKEGDSFTQLYCGPNISYEAKGLVPATLYCFRVQAVNSAGQGPYTAIASCMTPATCPSIVTSVKAHAKSTSISLSWKVPANNGSPITGYYIDIGEKELIFVGELTEYTIDEVLPDTTYRIRVRAVNNIGPGPFSSTVKCPTKSLPPDPPRVECIVVTCNSLKLKWGNSEQLQNRIVPTTTTPPSILMDTLINSNTNNSNTSNTVTTTNYNNNNNNQKLITYTVEMEGKDGIFNSIYTGTSYTYKINKLLESTPYNFRVCARNETGSGPWSEVYTFSTTKAPPNALKAPYITDISSTSCLINWQSHKPLGKDGISYILQKQEQKRENDYSELYKGEMTSYRVTNLEPGIDYYVRVCAIRVTNEGILLNGSYSPVTHFILPRPDELLQQQQQRSLNNRSSSNNYPHNISTSSNNNTIQERLLSSSLSSSSFSHHHASNSASSTITSTKNPGLSNKCISFIQRKMKTYTTFESRQLTDQEWAVIIFICFTLLAIFVAVMANFIYTKYGGITTTTSTMHGGIKTQ
ncbi:unnamed protein product, partial [Didymodactylos carnosus]